MSLSKDFYDPDYDPEVDPNDSHKCNNGCGTVVKIDGDVCQDCYDEE